MSKRQLALPYSFGFVLLRAGTQAPGGFAEVKPFKSPRNEASYALPYRAAILRFFATLRIAEKKKIKATREVS